MSKKPHINLAIIGHVDHGKSTLMGRLLFEMGVISAEELSEEAESFKFAWVLDHLKEERERGLTIDVAYEKLETSENMLTIIDSPGHQDFVKNMITGASQADAAVLVVAADDGIMPQTREHAALAYTLGVGQLVVVVNKMDSVNYDEKAFETLKEDLRPLLSNIGYSNVSEFPFVPASAFKGENVVDPSDKMEWYDGTTVLEALEGLEEAEKPVDKPLRVPVQNVHSVTGVGTVPIGRIETGVLRRGDKVVFNPPGVTGQVKSIEMHHEEIDMAEPGDNVGFNVRGVSKDEIQRGDVAGSPDDPPTVVKEFIGKVIILESPTYITPGFTPVFHLQSAHVPGEILEIQQKIDSRSGEVLEENPEFLKKGEAGVIRVKPQKPMVMEKASDIPQLGRFAIRHGGKTIAAGICMDLVPK
ncbi:elongation factor 1-alpha [candidate division MSBL1 archaeon SCGC-AAA259I09]|uniref:Elongation factor 1-alpha n=2 Tax=candidate division MSBL1 TaxID=215777 RepID=A0A133UUC9_9EURY|nr:elongation factor 1-alpha [candidate division MSBL1 archaeon SCGC-AAA259I09]KXA98801.1 elongation factor 1-alpha [candidate division MSBL1 archaeon SCGC-AAA259J03]